MTDERASARRGGWPRAPYPPALTQWERRTAEFDKGPPLPPFSGGGTASGSVAGSAGLVTLDLADDVGIAPPEYGRAEYTPSEQRRAAAYDPPAAEAPWEPPSDEAPPEEAPAHEAPWESPSEEAPPDEGHGSAAGGPWREASPEPWSEAAAEYKWQEEEVAAPWSDAAVAGPWDAITVEEPWAPDESEGLDLPEEEDAPDFEADASAGAAEVDEEDAGSIGWVSGDENADGVEEEDAEPEAGVVAFEGALGEPMPPGESTREEGLVAAVEEANELVEDVGWHERVGRWLDETEAEPAESDQPSEGRHASQFAARTVDSDRMSALAQRLEALAGDLRSEGEAALHGRLTRGERLDALLAAVLAGYLAREAEPAGSDDPRVAGDADFR